MTSKDKIVTAIFIRHALSLANVFKKEHKKNPTDNSYINSGLHEDGLKQISKNRDKIISHIQGYDVVITSPIRRAMQTCLLSLPEDFSKTKKYIYTCPLFSEMENLIENKGVSNDVIKVDEDVCSLPNFDKVSFYKFYYEYGWKTIFHKGWKKNPALIQSIGLLNNPWEGEINETFTDRENRVKLIKDFLSDNYFTGKKIVVFTHWGVIKALTGKVVNNLGIVKITFNQNTKSIQTCEVL